eukprot:2084118-Rhodomonas_salina.2
MTEGNFRSGESWRLPPGRQTRIKCNKPLVQLLSNGMWSLASDLAVHMDSTRVDRRLFVICMVVMVLSVRGAISEREGGCVAAPV